MTSVSTYLITDNKGFQELKIHWNQLLKASWSDNIFLTWEWMFNWWITFGENKDLIIIVAEKDGAVIGIAPFYRTRTTFFGIRPRTHIEFIGSTDTSSEYLDIISLLGQEEEAVNGILAELFNNKDLLWDVLHITDMREDSPNFKYCFQYFQEHNYNNWVYRRKSSPYIMLPPTMDEYLKTLSGNMRRKLKIYMKNIRMNGEVILHKVTDKAVLNARFREFRELHKLRWEKKIIKGETSGWNGKFLEFHMLIQESMMDNGWLYFVYIMSEKKMIAGQYSFSYNGKLNCYSGAFDPAMSNKNLGSVTQCMVVEDAIVKKYHELDFLSGSEEYKSYWTKVNHSTVDYGVWKSHSDFKKFNFEKNLRKFIRVLLPRTIVESLYGRLFARN
jgi:CelD/BcsL family acetyltransferase involved in cellulose biosynthesis